MALAACRPVTKCGKSGCAGSCPFSVVEHGCTAGTEPDTCAICGKLFRDRTSLSQTSYLPKVRGNRETGVATPLPPCVAAVEPPLPSPREQSETNGEDAGMEDCTETHQAEINKKIKANDKLRKILTNMPEKHRAMQSLDDEKAALLAARRQFLPFQRRIEKQKNNLERVSKEIDSKQRKRLEILQTWIEADLELEQPTSNRYKPSMRWRCWWLNRLQKTHKLSVKEIQGFRITRPDSFLIKLHSKPFSRCSNPFSQCKERGATVFRNSSCQLARLRMMSRKSVRLWHRQCSGTCGNSMAASKHIF